jgi:hypothetical protein
MTKDSKIWKNHKGEIVPANYVPDFDKKKEKVIERHFKRAQEVNALLDKFKKEALEQCDGIYESMMAHANIELSERKGNYTLNSFDKSIKIEVAVQDRIEFDDNINFAQKKIEEFLQLKMEGTDLELVELITNAFKTNKGKLDNKRILSLFRYKITHPLWLEAIELITKSIQTNSSTRYFTIWQKNEEGTYKQIQLNFSSI